MDLETSGPWKGLGSGSATGPQDKDLQRSNGTVRLAFAGSAQGTCIVDVYQRSPMRVMFPRIRHAPVSEAVLVNTAGGIAGGDRLDCEVILAEGASITVTSQTAERVYKALSAPAAIEVRLSVSDAASLAWLPQETIVFNGGRIRRRIRVEMSPGAEVLALETLVLGRTASGEVLTHGRISDGWEVRRNGRLIWVDRFHLGDDVFAHLHRQALLAGSHAVATLIYSGPELEARVQFVRDGAPRLRCDCAATVVGGLMVVRLTAVDPADLKQALRSILQPFDPPSARSPFRIPRMWSC